ncbi:uncharacterized protein METZ01_LOCUS314796 [marine metagenome]|uniref:Outer membrane lipoprotein-sorting protein n=1 Tax=marine metagenome TaxID=408172 RepID=A0A382NQB8_9ZZZZ
MILAIFVTLLTNLIPSISLAQSKAEQILNKLDNHYYYPQNKGLIRISSQLDWEQESIISEEKITIKKSEFIFEGQLNDKTFEKKVKPASSTKNTSSEKITQDIVFLNNYLDMFLPKTLREKFVRHKGKIGSRIGSETKLLFKKIESIENFNDYELFIEEKKWRISKVIVRQNKEPKKMEGEFIYSQKDGKWVVDETLSVYKINGKEYIEKTKYKYTKSKSIWLVNKINQSIEQDGHTILSYKFKLNDHKLKLKH